MKLLEVIFTLVFYAVAKVLIISGSGVALGFDFPSFSTPDIEFLEVDLDQDCGGFTDCLAFIGRIIYNAVLAVIFVISLIIRLLIYVGLLTVFIFKLLFADFPGAPWYINLFIAPYTIALGIVVYLMIRSGKTNA